MNQDHINDSKALHQRYATYGAASEYTDPSSHKHALTIPKALRSCLEIDTNITSILDHGTGNGGLPKLLHETVPEIKAVGYDPAVRQFSKKIDPLFDKAALIVFLVIIGIAVYQDLHLIPEYVRFAGIKTVLIFVLAFFMTIFLTRLFKINQSDKVTIIVETVLQNGGIGIVLGALIFSDAKFIFPVAAYALLQYLFILIYFSYLRMAKKI